MGTISEEYGVHQSATGSAESEPVVSVRGLVKRFAGHEAVALIGGGIGQPVKAPCGGW